MRFVLVVFVLLPFTSFSVYLSLDDLLFVSLTNNKEITSIKYAIFGFEKNRDFVSSFENPLLVSEFLIDGSNLEKMFGISLPLNFYKKPFLYELYDSFLRVKKSELEIKTYEVLTDLKKKYFRNLILIFITNEYNNIIESLNKLRGIVDSRYLSGRATLKDIVRVNTEISKVKVELNNVKQEIFSNERRIFYLMGLDQGNHVISYRYSDLTNLISIDVESIPYSRSIYLDLLWKEIKLSEVKYRFSYVDLLPDLMVTSKSDFM
ncbi:MAG: hypothetical protein ACK4F9_02910, partial [Brevinematia bacterium]